MGCKHSYFKRSSQSYSNSKNVINSTEIDLIKPDPDLGWIQASESAFYNTSLQYALGAAQSDLYTNLTENNHRSLHEQRTNYPYNWSVCFLNVRSGQFCRVSLIALSLNISIRAEKLAEAFGILNENSANTTRQSSTEDMSLFDRNRRPIYAALNIPDFGWTLLSRNVKDSFKIQQELMKKNKENHHHPPDEINVMNSLQLLKSGTGRLVHVDVPTIGMNTAEQLFRLERRKDHANFLPASTFDWTIETVSSNSTDNQFEVFAKSPKGELIPLVPEEMIMNIIQWVQQTYLTSVEF